MREKVLSRFHGRLQTLGDEVDIVERFPVARLQRGVRLGVALIDGLERRRSVLETGGGGEAPNGSAVIMRPIVRITVRAPDDGDEDLAALLNEWVGRVCLAVATDPVTGGLDASLGGSVNWQSYLGLEEAESLDPREGAQPIASVDVLFELSRSEADLTPYSAGF